MSARTKTLTRRKPIPKKHQIANQNRNPNRPFIEWVHPRPMMSARAGLATEWSEPRAEIENLKYKPIAVCFNGMMLLHYTDKYLLIFSTDPNCVCKYDIEKDEYIKVANYPFDVNSQYYNDMNIVLNQIDHKLYVFTLDYKYDTTSREEYDINHNLWCLDLVTATWTNCNFTDGLLLRKCKMIHAKDAIHIFYKFEKGIYHEKLQLVDDNFQFSVASNLAVDIPKSVYGDHVKVPEIVYFKSRNEIILFGNLKAETDGVWICDLNSIENNEYKWNVFEGVELPMSSKGKFMAVLDHFVVLISSKQDWDIRSWVIDIWCLDLLSKEWYIGKKHLPGYIKDNVNEFIETENEYIHYYDRDQNHFRFSLMDVMPEKMKMVNGDLCKKLVYGFIAEIQCDLSNDVPTMLKNIIGAYFTSVF